MTASFLRRAAAGACLALCAASFGELYSDWTAAGLVLSDKAASLEGSSVTMTGYMAPPLTPTIRFFVLTEVPMSVCPFCSSDADWPDNIIVVKVSEPVTALPDAGDRERGR